MQFQISYKGLSRVIFPYGQQHDIAAMDTDLSTSYLGLNLNSKLMSLCLNFHFSKVGKIVMSAFIFKGLNGSIYTYSIQNIVYNNHSIKASFYISSKANNSKLEGCVPYTILCSNMLLLLSRISRVRLCATPQMAAHQAPPSLGFSRQEHWSGLPFPSPMHESEVAQLCLTLSDPMDCSPPVSSVHGILQARVPEWVASVFSQYKSKKVLIPENGEHTLREKNCYYVCEI